MEQAARGVKRRGACPIPGAFKDSVPHKVMQSEAAVSMLVQTSDRVYWHLVFPLTVWLQCLDSTKGHCYWHALQQLELKCRSIASRFGRTQRLSATDGDGAVAMAERAFDSKSPDLQVLHTTCQVHHCAGIRKKAMALNEPAITAVVHTCLALNFSSNMSNFRQDLRELLESMLDYRRGPAPAEHRLRRKALLDTFCGGSDRASQLRRVIFETMANGGLQGDRFQHWCTGCCDGKADCVWKLQTYFVAAVAGVVPKIFSRSRWTGQELSLNFIGLLEGCNRLFTKTFAEFAMRSARAGKVQPMAQLDKP